MITLLGAPRQDCSGLTRRETLTAGALTVLGGMFNTAALQRLEASPGREPHEPRAKSVILLYLQGGAPTQDMFDLKPHAPLRRRR